MRLDPSNATGLIDPCFDCEQVRRAGLSRARLCVETLLVSAFGRVLFGDDRGRLGEKEAASPDTMGLAKFFQLYYPTDSAPPSKRTGGERASGSALACLPLYGHQLAPSTAPRRPLFLSHPIIALPTFALLLTDLSRHEHSACPRWPSPRRPRSLTPPTWTSSRGEISTWTDGRTAVCVCVCARGVLCCLGQPEDRRGARLSRLMSK